MADGGRAITRPSAALPALVALEDRAQQYETALMKVLDAVDLHDAKDIAQRAISDAYFGPVEERGHAG